MPYYSGRHDHSLTATHAPEPTPEQTRQRQERIHAQKLAHLSAIAAHIPNATLRDDHRPGVQASGNGFTLAAFASWNGDTCRMELNDLTPAQAERLAAFLTTL